MARRDGASHPHSVQRCDDDASEFGERQASARINATLEADREFAEAYRRGVVWLLLDAPMLAPCNDNERIEMVSNGRGDPRKMGPLPPPERPQVNQTKSPDFLKGNRDDSARAKEQQRGCTGRHRLVASIDPTPNSY
jgi:hypothetical protein